MPDPSDRNAIAADAALMALVADGDEVAFAGLMREESPRLARFALSVLGNAAEVEEILQETFLKLWRTAPEWRASARIGTWLHVVAYRLCIDRLRLRRPTLDLDEASEIAADGSLEPEQQLVRRDEERLVAWALDQLAPRQKAAVALAYHQGLSQAQAAQVLDCTQEAYESLLARARRRLRELLSAADSAAGPG